MNYIKKSISLCNNYLLARWLNKPSTAGFWYLPEKAIIKNPSDACHYKNTFRKKPLYLMDYTKKLGYSLKSAANIIALPYQAPIGIQINPEAAFQYALGLHDKFEHTSDAYFLNEFLLYSDYFLSTQNSEGLWAYDFDWFEAKAPWYSALAQARGASVMLRAGMKTGKTAFYEATKKALSKFPVSTVKQGFAHEFSPEKCFYFEEYPDIPTAVINGFMAALISIWDVNQILNEAWLKNLWMEGIHSLQIMLPYYTNGWWSLYDLDKQSPFSNLNSPRYHLLEIEYLHILSLLSKSPILEKHLAMRIKQYGNKINYCRAFTLKLIKKITYK